MPGPDHDRFMDILDTLAGQGRIPVEDLSHRDDPRLHIRTPEGVIQTARTPDSIQRDGSSTKRRWTWVPYWLEEERDTQPDVEHPHAVVVEERDD